MNTTQIAEQNRNRDQQNVLSILADGLPHIFDAGEPLMKACRALKKAGLVTIEALPRRQWAVKQKP